MTISNYSSLANYLYDLASRKPKKFGLEKITSIFQRLNLKLPKFIHVAGTNGKGSVTFKIYQALHLSGYKAALFSSPHISSFRERITIENKPITEELIFDAFLYLKKHQKEVELTFFETLFLLALIAFSLKEVEYAVIEVGLGGRLDATNIIHPILSVITHIGFDHMALLGDTLEKIAKEKAGIIKRKVPVILGPNANYAAIYEQAQRKEAPIFQVQKSEYAFYDEENSTIATRALSLLQELIPINNSSIHQALSMRPKCRFELIENGSVLLDVAHNEAGIKSLLKAIRYFFPTRKLRFLMGVSKERDVNQLIQLLPKNASLHLVSIDHPRLKTLQEIKESLIIKREIFFEDLTYGMDHAKSRAFMHDELLVITGSFFIMSSVRQMLGFKEPVDGLLLQEKSIAV